MIKTNMPSGIFYEDDKYKIEGWWSTGSHFEVINKLTKNVVHTGYFNHSIDLSFEKCWERLIKEAESK